MWQSAKVTALPEGFPLRGGQVRVPPWQAYLERQLSQQERTWDGEEVEGGDTGREEAGQAALEGGFGEGAEGVLGGLAGEERLMKA